MKPFSELTRRELGLEILQWLCVLPAAALGAYVVAIACNAASGITRNMSDDQYASLIDAVRFILYYIPRKAAFVFIGAKTAPRWRLPTGFALALMAILASLMVHILGQKNVGTLNYAHFATESIGALIGVACLYYSEQRSSESKLPNTQTDASLTSRPPH